MARSFFVLRMPSLHLTIIHGYVPFSEQSKAEPFEVCWQHPMTKILDIIERVKTWPLERQEDAASMLEAMERSGTDFYNLSDDERRAVDAGLKQANGGEFVSDVDMEKFWNRHHV